LRQLEAERSRLGLETIARDVKLSVSLKLICLLYVAGMKYKHDDDDRKKERMQEWEKVNALEYVRQDRIARKQETDERVISIENRCS